MSILNSNAINKIKDWATGEYKSHNFPHGKNLFDKNSVSADKIINVDGTESAAAGWGASDFIPVIPKSNLVFNTLTASALAYSSFYDKDKNFISGSSKTNNDVISSGYKISAPQNAAYLRFSINNTVLNTTQLEYGEVATLYEAFTAVPTQPNFLKPQDVRVTNETINVLASNILVPHGKNMFDKSKVIANKILTIDGTIPITNNSGWYVSDYIPVISGSEININNVAVSAEAYSSFYDKDKNFISGSSINNNDLIANNNVRLVPENAVFFRFSNRTTIIDSTQVEYGDKATRFEKYSPIETLPKIIGEQDVRVTNDVDVKVTNLLYNTGKNMFNKETAVLDTIINASGTQTPASGWYTSDFIEVKEGDKLIFNTLNPTTSGYTAFYNESKVFITGSSINNTTLISQGRIITVPLGAKYLKFTNLNTAPNAPELMQLERGVVSTKLEPYIPYPTQPNFADTQDVNVKNSLNTAVTNLTYPHGKNLFNKDTVTVTRALNASGVEFAAAGWYVSDFIPVQPNSDIKLSGSYLGTDKYSAFYDKDKKFIPNSQVSSSDLVANNLVLKSPTNAAFLRFSAQLGIENISPETMQVEYGKTTTSYESYIGKMTTPNFADAQDVKIVDGSPKLEGYSLISHRDKYKIFKFQRGKRIVAIHENIVVAVQGASNGLAIGSTIYIGTNGVDGQYNYSVVYDSTNFPNLKAGSLIEEVMVLPFTRNMTVEQTGKQYRICIITNNGQIYHNFPARSTTNDGVAQSLDIIKFDESVVWDIKDKRFPSTSPNATGTEIYYPGLPASNYVYEPAISSDNGYGNGGFPKEITKNGVTYARFYNPQKNAFHPFGFMGGFEPTKKLSVIGTYRSNSIREQGSRMCFFATSDGGRSWWNKYEFASLSGDNNAGVQIDTSSLGLGAYTTSSFILKEVKHTIPTEENKEPSTLFEFGSEVVINSIAVGKPTVFTTATAHGLINNAVIVIQDNSSSSNTSPDWDWLRNDAMGVNSGGTGMMFKIERLSDTTFALREYIHNPFNNIACRHIHSINRVKDGFTMGCGEFYPHGWNFYIQTHEADDFSILNAWEDLKIVRLTSTEDAAKRSLGFTIKDDPNSTVIFSSDEAFVPRSPVQMPSGRTQSFTRNSTGVFIGKLSDMDDFTKFECIFEAQEPAFFFKEKAGVYIFCGQRGEAGFSFDGGETWEKDHFKEMVRYFRGQSNNLVLINDTFIYFN